MSIGFIATRYVYWVRRIVIRALRGEDNTVAIWTADMHAKELLAAKITEVQGHKVIIRSPTKEGNTK